MATLGVAFEYFCLDAEELRDLVDKCTRTAGAHTVHAHVGGDELTGGLVLFEEHNLGILTAEFDGDPGIGVGGTHGKCVCDYFLHKEGVSGLGERLTAATAERDPEVLAREKGMGFAQDLVDLFRLHGVMTLICIV